MMVARIQFVFAPAQTQLGYFLAAGLTDFGPKELLTPVSFIHFQVHDHDKDWEC